MRTLFGILLFTQISFFVYTTPVFSESSLAFRIGIFDSSDPRIEDYYGYSPVGSLEYEWLHKSGFGGKTKVLGANTRDSVYLSSIHLLLSWE